MRINKLIASAVLSLLLGLQAWTLKQVVDLKVTMASVLTRLDNSTHIAKN
jgi:hypothetical protein